MKAIEIKGKRNIDKLKIENAADLIMIEVEKLLLK